VARREATGDPSTWVPVTPNTVRAAAQALLNAAERYERIGWKTDAAANREIARLLRRSLDRWEGAK
jgi:hypothetical protein